MKSRPLTVVVPIEKIMKRAIRAVLESIYDPEFLDTSHFRPGRGCHSALIRIRKEWGYSNWFLEFGISKCFHTIDRHRLIPILKEEIDGGAGKNSLFFRLIGPPPYRSGTRPPSNYMLDPARRFFFSPIYLGGARPPLDIWDRDMDIAATRPPPDRHRAPPLPPLYRVENSREGGRGRPPPRGPIYREGGSRSLYRDMARDRGGLSRSGGGDSLLSGGSRPVGRGAPLPLYLLYGGPSTDRERGIGSRPSSVLLSALLGNIYLHKLDQEIERIQQKHAPYLYIPIVRITKLVPDDHPDDQYALNLDRELNRPYSSKGAPLSRSRGAGEGFAPPYLDRPPRPRGARSIYRVPPSRSMGPLGGGRPRPEGGIRICYARYADDFLLGIVGTVELPRGIQKRITHFLQSGLNGSAGFTTIAARSTVEFPGTVIRATRARGTRDKIGGGPYRNGGVGPRELEKRRRAKHRIHLTASHLRSAIHSKLEDLGRSIPIQQLCRRSEQLTLSIYGALDPPLSLSRVGHRSTSGPHRIRSIGSTPDLDRPPQPPYRHRGGGPSRYMGPLSPNSIEGGGRPPASIYIAGENSPPSGEIGPNREMALPPFSISRLGERWPSIERDGREMAPSPPSLLYLGSRSYDQIWAGGRAGAERAPTRYSRPHRIRSIGRGAPLPRGAYRSIGGPKDPLETPIYNSQLYMEGGGGGPSPSLISGYGYGGERQLNSIIHTTLTPRSIDRVLSRWSSAPPYLDRAPPLDLSGGVPRSPRPRGGRGPFVDREPLSELWCPPLSLYGPRPPYLYMGITLESPVAISIYTHSIWEIGGPHIWIGPNRETAPPPFSISRFGERWPYRERDGREMAPSICPSRSICGRAGAYRSRGEHTLESLPRPRGAISISRVPPSRSMGSRYSRGRVPTLDSPPRPPSIPPSIPRGGALSRSGGGALSRSGGGRVAGRRAHAHIERGRGRRWPGGPIGRSPSRSAVSGSELTAGKSARQESSKTQIKAPVRKILQRLRDRGIISRRRAWPTHVACLTNVGDEDIVNRFAGVAISLPSHYRCRDNFYQVRTIVDYQIRWSAISTPAHKHKSSARKIIPEYSRDLHIVNGGKTLAESPNSIELRKLGPLTSEDLDYLDTEHAYKTFSQVYIRYA
nr:maturase-related protein [Taxus chinensis]WAI96678.1 maturase-related protein [Taxus chinensis]